MGTLIRHSHLGRDRQLLGACPGCDKYWLTNDPAFERLAAQTIALASVMRTHFAEYTSSPVPYDTAAPASVEMACVMNGVCFTAVIDDGELDVSAAPVARREQVTGYGKDNRLLMFCDMRECGDPEATRA